MHYSIAALVSELNMNEREAGRGGFSDRRSFQNERNGGGADCLVQCWRIARDQKCLLCHAQNVVVDSS